MSSTYVLYAFHNFLSNILFYLFIYINSQFNSMLFLTKRSEEVLLIFFVFLEISKMHNRMEMSL